MKKILICIAFLLCAFHLPVSADGLRENEIINIGVIVNNDNSIEIIASTTKKTIGPTRAFLVFEEDDDPEQASAILIITTIGSAQTIHEKWSGGTPLDLNERFYEYTDENGMLKPGRYFAVVTEFEGNGDILTDRAYFTIPAIEQWWTPQPTQAPTPTPTEEPTPDATAKPTPKKTAAPVHTASPAPKASSGIGTIHIAAYVILGVIICAELVVICYLAKKKK